MYDLKNYEPNVLERLSMSWNPSVGHLGPAFIVIDNRIEFEVNADLNRSGNALSSFIGGVSLGAVGPVRR
ncbi:YfiR family protein [Halalkalicoccus salilacus]|uniref:hypothetical protein n=1 Tax=Halalkalicoccus salilacus TaxID=3117459 RepID=UPI00300E73DE